MSKVGHRTEGEILRAWAWEQIDSGQTQSSFAHSLVDAYIKFTPEGSRSLSLESPDEYPLDADSSRVATSNRKSVERWLKGTQPIPADLVYAWMQALVGNYREGCIAEWYGRFGYLPVPNDQTHEAATQGQMTCTLGEIFKAVEEAPEKAVSNIRRLKAQLSGLELSLGRR